MTVEQLKEANKKLSLIEETKKSIEYFKEDLQNVDKAKSEHKPQYRVTEDAYDGCYLVYISGVEETNEMINILNKRIKKYEEELKGLGIIL